MGEAGWVVWGGELYGGLQVSVLGGVGRQGEAKAGLGAEFGVVLSWKDPWCYVCVRVAF